MVAVFFSLAEAKEGTHPCVGGVFLKTPAPLFEMKGPGEVFLRVAWTFTSSQSFASLGFLGLSWLQWLVGFPFSPRKVITFSRGSEDSPVASFPLTLSMQRLSLAARSWTIPD